MSKLVENNPWLTEELLESPNGLPSELAERKPSVFFVKQKHDTSNVIYGEDSQHCLAHKQFRDSAISDSLEFIDFLLTDVQLRQSQSLSREMKSRLVEALRSSSKNIETLKYYVGTFPKPPKRFALAYIDQIKTVDLKQQEEKEYIENQSRLFDEAIKEKILIKYEGKYILFENGNVLDSGDSRAEVAMRAYEKHGMKTLFIEQVLSGPRTLAAVWTPFLRNE
jgi:hypothetical protein